MQAQVAALCQAVRAAARAAAAFRAACSTLPCRLGKPLQSQSAKPTTLTAQCIFDMDGLLLDTESAYTVAQKEVLSKYGKEFTYELKAKMMGKKALDAANILVDETGLRGQLEPEDFLTMREAILDKLFAEAPLMPGVEKLLRHLHAHGVPMAVATSSHRRHFDLKTERHREVFALFDHIITGDQVAKGKPDPEIFLKAAAAFGNGRKPASPAACLVFEDAPVGVEAGVAAGMQVVAVPDPRIGAGKCAAAAQVLESLEQFDPAAWGLPAYAEAAGGGSSGGGGGGGGGGGASAAVAAAPAQDQV